MPYLRKLSRCKRIMGALAVIFAGSLLWNSPDAVAEVTRFQILEVESPTFEGRKFGGVGQYEKIVARAFLQVDPDLEQNAHIVDVGLAPKNSAGHVEFAADVVILKPIELSMGNKRIVYGVVNRGNKGILRYFNDAVGTNDLSSADDAGNGHLMGEGYTVVWSGWDGSVVPGDGRMRLEVPVLEGLTGTAHDQIIFDHEHNPFVADLSYPAADLDPSKAKLTVRQNERDPRQTPADLSFEYFALTTPGFAWGTRPNQIVIHRPAGFDAGAIYEISYPARDPAVLGLAFASIRDVVSFLRHRAFDSVDIASPLAPNGRPVIHYAYAFGQSQSGRLLRDFLYQGFNEDENGRMVFDGIIPHTAGSRKTFINYRWGQPGLFSRQHETHLTPGDQFPFTYGVLTDTLTGKRDGILARCLQTQSCPRVFHTDTSVEFWQARSSLIVTDTNGEDIELPNNVRAYLFAGAPHGSSANATPQPSAVCQGLSNPIHVGPPMRALLRALDHWVSEDIDPPESRFPSHVDGTFVTPDPESINFPSIPDLEFSGLINNLQVTDYSVWPPKVADQYPVFVPMVDADGNDVPGLRLPSVAVPRASYLGWSYRRDRYAEGELCHNRGASFQFAETRAEREASGDPRLSIEERFSTHEVYVQRVKNVVDQLIEARFLLPEDEQRLKEKAAH